MGSGVVGALGAGARRPRTQSETARASRAPSRAARAARAGGRHGQSALPPLPRATRHRMNELTAPPPPAPEPRMLPYSFWWPIAGGALAGLLMRLVFSGAPGDAYSTMLGSFIVGSPVLVGFLTVYLAERTERRSWSYYFAAPVMSSAV